MSRQIQRAIFSSFTGLACLLCLPAVGRAQLPSSGRDHAISGSVRNEENDSPIPQVRVQLQTDSGSSAHPTVLTTSGGEFMFGQFPAGEYDVIAELDGYYSARVRVDITRHDAVNLIIRLRKLSAAAAPSGDLTTAH